MRSEWLKSAVAGVLAVGMIFSIGCIFNPKPDETPNPGPKIDWKDLTDKEDCITNMLLAYLHRDKQHYNELLHPEYLWYLQPQDAQEYNQETLDYAQDTYGTGRMFDKAVILDLEIEYASWNEIDRVGEVPCPGCWETTRIYFISVQFIGNETIYMGHDTVQFIVVPVEDAKDGRTEYRIRWAYDIDSL